MRGGWEILRFFVIFWIFSVFFFKKRALFRRFRVPRIWVYRVVNEKLEVRNKERKKSKNLRLTIERR